MAGRPDLLILPAHAEPPVTRSPPLRIAATLLAMLSATTILSQFFRSSLNVIAPELIRDLALSPEVLGLGQFGVLSGASHHSGAGRHPVRSDRGATDRCRPCAAVGRAAR